MALGFSCSVWFVEVIDSVRFLIIFVSLAADGISLSLKKSPVIPNLFKSLAGNCCGQTALMAAYQKAFESKEPILSELIEIIAIMKFANLTLNSQEETKIATNLSSSGPEDVSSQRRLVINRIEEKVWLLSPPPFFYDTEWSH